MAGNQTKIFTVDRFLGIDESADGTTELGMGVASKMENFFVTDDLNLKTRPGIRTLMERSAGGEIVMSWHGWIGDAELLAIADKIEVPSRVHGRLWIYKADGNAVLPVFSPSETVGTFDLGEYGEKPVNLFAYGGYLYLLTPDTGMCFDGKTVRESGFDYEPKVIVAASPAGGGTELEGINLLTPYRIAEYSGDGKTAVYVLPSEAKQIARVTVDGAEVYGWNYDVYSHSCTFASAPAEGTSNVVFRYKASEEETAGFREKICRMKLHEAYNGSTDTRMFLAGDGTNICYYTSPPLYGRSGDLYIPSINEVSVDMSGSPITGLARHYSRLLVFKSDGVFSITYEPTTLPGGDTVAGFYLRSVSKGYGHSGYGNIEIVGNNPRSFTSGGIYSWRQTSSYRDERYAQRCSEAVNRTMGTADMGKLKAVDDDAGQTYYIFLNDNYGTILCNRYSIGKQGVWCVYRSEIAKGVRAAYRFGGAVIFLTDTDCYRFDNGYLYDKSAGGEPVGIKAVWESGYQHFGSDMTRKYSSELFVSASGNVASSLVVTASTDKRDSYMEKSITTPAVFSFLDFRFSGLSFRGGAAPKIQRIRLKVKKFIYYKLIFKVETPGANLTILGYDQTVRFASKAK